MLSIESQTLQFLQKNARLSDGNSLKHFQFIRKRDFEKKNKKIPLFNELSSRNSGRQKLCDQVVRKKLQQEYSPRKQPGLMNSPMKRFPSKNGYSLMVEENKKLQTLMLNSLKKSFNISKKPFSQAKSSLIKHTGFDFCRSKTGFSVQHRMYQSQYQLSARTYQQMALGNSEVSKKYKRMVRSSIGQQSDVKSAKKLSIVQEFFKTKCFSESKLTPQ